MTGFRRYLSALGPGIAIAATGVGAGDMVAAAVSGSRYGFAVIWAAVIGAWFKFVLNEGLARWQLATGTTLLEGWAQRLGRWVQYYFLAYLILWSFIVGGALISACGLAAHAIAPALSVAAWGVIHSLVAAGVVLLGNYQQFEKTMKIFIGVMFATILGCALLVDSPLHTLSQSFSRASVPAGSPRFILGIIGGVGGSLTLLAYGYWMRERKWHGRAFKATVRFDLGVSYFLTGVFGVAIMVLASVVLHGRGQEIEGSRGVLQMASMLKNVMGSVGHWAFLIGFWGAVTTSTLGVWQGVPYMFSDFVALMRKLPRSQHDAIVSSKSKWYRGFLAWLAFAPLLLLLFDKPVALIILYAVIGALFMPFLSATLLYMNSRKAWVGDEFRNGWLTNLSLIITLILFGYLFVEEIMNML